MISTHIHTHGWACCLICEVSNVLINCHNKPSEQGPMFGADIFRADFLSLSPSLSLSGRSMLLSSNSIQLLLIAFLALITWSRYTHACLDTDRSCQKSATLIQSITLGVNADKKRHPLFFSLSHSLTFSVSIIVLPCIIDWLVLVESGRNEKIHVTRS